MRITHLKFNTLRIVNHKLKVTHGKSAGKIMLKLILITNECLFMHIS